MGHLKFARLVSNCPHLSKSSLFCGVTPGETFPPGTTPLVRLRLSPLGVDWARAGPPPFSDSNRDAGGLECRGDRIGDGNS